MKTNLLALAASLPLLATVTGTATAAVSIPAGGVTVNFAAVPSGLDFASVSVAGGGGDLTALGTGANQMDNPTTGISATLAWPAVDTVWTAAANTIAAEPAAQSNSAQIRYVTGTAKMLTGPTGNRYSALVGRFQNATGSAMSSFDLTWTLGTPVDSAGTGAVNIDPLAGIHVYVSKTGLIGSWTRVNGPFGSPDGPVAAAAVTFSGVVANGADFYLAWIDDNGPASATSPDFEGNYTIDDVVISNIGAPNAAVTATVSNILRDDNLTPLNPNDDKINFTLTVAGSGSVGAGWITTTPAAFANSGTYGVPTNFVGVPISEFAAAGHSVTVTVDDAGAAASDTFTVTAPWCSLAASANSFTYSEAGTPDNAGDDSVSYLASATGSYTGSTYDVDTAPAQNVAYGSAASVVSGPGTAQTLNFTDSADATCTTQLVVNTPAIIGVNNLSGAPANLKSLAAFGTRIWTLDGTARTATQVSATQVDHTILSEVVDLSSVGGVIVTAELDAIAGTDNQATNSSGFEAADHYQLDLIIDGGTPVSILGAGDTNGNGLLEGAAAGVGTELPDTGLAPVNTPKVVKNFTFSAIVPPGANSVQIRIIGNSNSGNETFVFKNLSLAPAPASLQASVATGVVRNKGTDTAADDTIEAPVTIIPINLGASTGWTSDLLAPDAPASGLYSAANPVTFSVAAASAPKTVNLSDAFDVTKTASVVITAPARTFTAALAATPNIVRHDNGPGLADDTVTFDITVSGTNGGPRFTLATDPGTATATSYAISAAATTVPVTISPVPSLASTVYLRVFDTSYPASSANLAVAVPAAPVAPAQYVIGKQNLSGGLTDVVSFAGDALPAQLMNYPGLPALIMHNGGTLATVRSEVLNLSAVGDVSFSARVHTVDTSSGFEDADTFSAVLILDGDTANPVRVTDAFDLDDPKNGLEGAELAVTGGTVGNPTVTDHNLTYLIPAGVNSAQLEVSTLNNSANESLTFDNVLFSVSTGPVDSDGDGMDDAYETANDLNPNSNADRDTDLDGDGQSNINEYTAGTAANNAASTLKITTIAPSGNPSEYNVSIATVVGKKYQLQVSTDLGKLDSWGDIPGVVTATTATTTVPVNINGLGARHFLRAKVVP